MSEMENTHTLTYDVCSDTGEVLKACFTLDKDNAIIKIQAFKKDEPQQEVELSEKDIEILKTYTKLMLEDIKKNK
jgi:hypothetical protein